MRKQYTAAFKAHLVREVLKEEKPLNQIALEHGVHRNLLTQWRDQALAGLPSLFSRQYERKRIHTEARPLAVQARAGFLRCWGQYSIAVR
jgi:transposase-like protein